MEWAIAAAVGAIVVACLRHGRIGMKPPRTADPSDGPAAEPVFEPSDFEPDSLLGDELDLHGVKGRDIDELVDEFVRVSCEAGRTCVTIVHGRGSGILRRRVRARLRRNSGVAHFEDATGRRGGATAIWLVPLADDRAPV
jgi:hypothetical protein